MSETQIPITTSKYRDNNDEDAAESGGCDACIVGFFTVIIILLFPIFLPFCIKIVQVSHLLDKCASKHAQIYIYIYIYIDRI